jgi:DMSO/TMAO reductase YedYZ heme-binding membrane subunit
MTRKLRTRFWVEAVFGCASAFLFVLTLVWRDWIEALFGVDPDHHSGSLEWTVASVLLVAALLLGVRARAEWRRPGLGNVRTRLGVGA